MGVLSRVSHAIHVANGEVREVDKAARLGPTWRAVEREHLERHPTCFACRGKDRVHVHHLSDDPALAFEPSNLLTLCMGASECHLRIGHGGDWAKRNPLVIAIAGGARQVPAAFAKFVEQAKKEAR